MTSSGVNKFSILFNGELLSGVSRDASLDRLSVLTNIERSELLDALFSVKPVIINQVEDEELAETYRKALQDSGLQVWVEPLNIGHDEIINVELEFGHYAPLERTQSTPNYVIDTDELEPVQAAADIPLSAVSENAEDGQDYAVIFHGELEPGFTKAEAVDNIRHLTKATHERIVEELFSVVPVIIKRTSSKALAEEYLAAFGSAGMKLELATDLVDPDLSESRLVIRYDAPPASPPRRTRRFTYYLLGVAALTVVAWGLIFVFFDGLFRQPQELTLEIKIQAAQPVAPAPVPKSTSPVKPERPVAKPKPVPQETTVTKPVVAPPPKPATRQSQPRVKSNARREAAEQSYYMALLSWFAHPRHQQYDSETRQLNLEGEIELQITITRDGTLKDVTVSRSSSEELTEVTTATARRASPYPAVPDAISGVDYSFKLPLKYTLDDSP